MKQFLLGSGLEERTLLHFKVFGFVYYKLIPDAIRGKLDDRSRVTLLIGQHSTCAYEFYCPIINKVEITKDVIVKESEIWDWSKYQSNSNVVSTLESDSASGGDSEYEGESEFEYDYESKGESCSEYDFDSEGDSDSEGVSDPEGDSTYEVDHASEGDTAFEGEASEG